MVPMTFSTYPKQMCDPVTLTVATLGLTAGSTYMQHEAGVKAAENQSEALTKQDAFRQMDLERQMQQQNAQAADEMNAAHRSALSDMATLNAIAGEFGGGATAERGKAVSNIQAGETLATVGSNARNGLAETGYAASSSRENTLAQIRSIQGPSQIGTLLSLGAQATGSYNSYQTNKRLDKLASEGKTVQ